MEMRLKPARYLDEDVMLLELREKYYKTNGIVGCKYQPTIIPESFKEACGRYQVSDERFKDVSCKCSLKLEADVLILEITALNSKICFSLKVIDEKHAITQGFGRLARQTVELGKKDEGYCLTFSGIVFKKV